MLSFVKSKYIWIMVHLYDVVCSYLLFANFTLTQGIECQAIIGSGDLWGLGKFFVYHVHTKEIWGSVLL